MESISNIEFKFSYLALKLLGKNLYSNAWAALSELVANGLDAKADSVYLYIDMRQKRKAVIEVFDNGEGMSYKNLSENYVRIGRNRRFDQGNPDDVMGRKGIGKLAALFLSRHYYISSKTKDSSLLTYEMDFSVEKENENDQNPEMKLASGIDFDNKNFFDFENGTMVRMEDVDLKGYADVSIDSLNNVLADFFSIDNLSKSNIYLKIVESDDEVDKKFVQVKKKIPFGNMVEIACFDDETYERLSEEYEGNIYKLPYKKFDSKFFEGVTKIKEEKLEKKEFFIPNSEEKSKIGEIKGWLGIHSSISQNIAWNNDNNFKKNKLYNPLQLRIYVRNKLAVGDFLPIINNTQVFVNFIEGEISFDILDDNDFPDIATTSRQNMDENDGRIIFLAEQVKTQVTKLIRARQKVRDEMQVSGEKLDQESNSVAKEKYSQVLDKTLGDLKTNVHKTNEPKAEEDFFIEAKDSLLRNLNGESLKRNYMIFFSHSRDNKDIIDFFYNLLLNHGVNEDEMFYTSKDTRPEVDIKKKLGEISKKNIIDTSTIMFFYSTKDFLKSQYCMFEGGAAWATRTPKDFFITFDNYSNIPAYLLPSDEFLLEITCDTDIFSGDIYNRVIQSLNFLLKHINDGREIGLYSQLPYFEEVKFPDKPHFAKGERPKLDSQLIEYWDAYIKSGTLIKAIDEKYIIQ